MTQYLINIWSASVFGSLFFILFLILRPFILHRLSKNIQYVILILIMLRFLFIIPINIELKNESPIIYYKNQFTTQINKPINDMQQTAQINETFNTTKNISPEIENTQINKPFIFEWDLLIPIISIAIFVYHCFAYIRFKILLNKTCKQVSIIKESVFLKILADLNIKSRIKLHESEALSSPICIGVLRPTIIIPTNEYTQNELKTMLYHELTHLKYKDVLFKWVTLVMICIHFFNPIVYILRKKINIYMELCCDEKVIATMEKDEKQNYGQLLIQMATTESKFINSGFASMSEEKQSLKERLVSIMKYKKKSFWIKIISVFVFVICLFCLAFSGMTFAGDELNSEKEFEIKLEKARTIRNNSKWASFTEKLKQAQLLPASLVDRCKISIDSPYTDHFNWEDEGNGMGTMIRIYLRGDDLRSYNYSNGGKTKVVEEINPIDNNKAIDKSILFLKIYNIGSSQLNEMIKNNTLDRSKIKLEKITNKNPSYNTAKITMNLSEKDIYEFTVDMNMGAIIEFKNLYQEELSKRDVQLSDVTILKGLDYIDENLKPNQVHLWTDKNGRVLTVNYDRGYDIREKFFTEEDLVKALKYANKEDVLPKGLDIKEADIVYYLTPENVDYSKPVKTTKIQEDVYFKVFDLKGDYKKNIKEIISYIPYDNLTDVGYRYLLVNDDFNFYMFYDKSFKFVTNDEKQKDYVSENTTEAVEVHDPNYKPPTETISYLEHQNFDRVILKKVTSEDNSVDYNIDAVKRISPITCYDRFIDTNLSETVEFTGVEVMYFVNSEEAKEKMLKIFKDK